MDYPPSGCAGPGEWTAFASGDSYRAYTLSVGSLFHVHLRDTGSRIYYSFNGESLASGEPRDILMRKAEAEIVRRVREMLPAYKAIHARVDAALALKTANVTILRPKKD